MRIFILLTLATVCVGDGEKVNLWKAPCKGIMYIREVLCGSPGTFYTGHREVELGAPVNSAGQSRPSASRSSVNRPRRQRPQEAGKSLSGPMGPPIPQHSAGRTNEPHVSQAANFTLPSYSLSVGGLVVKQLIPGSTVCQLPHKIVACGLIKTLSMNSCLGDFYTDGKDLLVPEGCSGLFLLTLCSDDYIDPAY